MTQSNTYPDAPLYVAYAKRLCEAAGLEYRHISGMLLPREPGRPPERPMAVIDVGTSGGQMEMVLDKGEAILANRHTGEEIARLPCPETA